MSLTDNDIRRVAAKLAELISLEGSVRPTVSVEQLSDVLCDSAEALEILNISRSSLYRLLKQGVVTRRKFGRHNRFDRAELRAVVEKMRRGESVFVEEAGE